MLANKMCLPGDIRVKSRRIRFGMLIAGLAALVLVIAGMPASAAGSEPDSAVDAPNAICPPNGQCFADVPPGSQFYTATNRLFEQDVITGFPCGGTNEPCDSFNRPYYRPTIGTSRQVAAQFLDNARSKGGIFIDVSSNSHFFPVFVRTAQQGVTVISGVATSGGTGVYGDGGNNGYGVSGTASNFGTGVYGKGYGYSIGVSGKSDTGYGVYGETNSGNFSGVYGRTYGTGEGVYGYSGGSGTGVYGYSYSGIGINGQSGGNTGVFGRGYSIGVNGESTSGNGVVGFTYGGGGYGIFGYGVANRAGYFSGNVQVTGSLSKGAGSFKIDHPLDPENKYLYHSFVESPDMMNVYNGNVTLDAKGEASVQLPEWFGALNKDYRYQLTAVGAPGPNLYVSRKVENNRFGIAGGTAGMEVSWQVTGIRQDPYANAHRIPVEEVKPADERGQYLHPTEWGKPESLGVDFEERQRIKQAAPPQSKP